MEKVIFMSIFIAVFFFVMKIIEIKYFQREQSKGLKFVIRDAFMVLFSSMVILHAFIYFETYIMDFIGMITNEKKHKIIDTEVFTDEPGF